MKTHQPMPHTYRVLYVEDEPINVVMMQAVFERYRPDCELQVMNDGASALAAAHGFQPDLLLLDIWLPDCMGSELLKRLRQIPGYAETPAVAVTSDTGFDIAGTSFCERWLKPIRIDCVQVGLDRLLPRETSATPHYAHAA